MSGGSIDHDTVRTIAQIMAETGLTEVEWEAGEQRLRLSRAAPPAAQPAPPVASPGAPAAPAPEPAAEAAAPASGPGTGPGSVTAPMVGTAYLSQEPGAPPFVRLGDSVAEGDTLLIIEAMKVMNPIRAPHAGTVTRILVRDAQPVEYGEVLMDIE